MRKTGTFALAAAVAMNIAGCSSRNDAAGGNEAGASTDNVAVASDETLGNNGISAVDGGGDLANASANAAAPADNGSVDASENGGNSL